MAKRKTPATVSPAEAAAATAGSVRIFTDWTPAKIRSAELQAEQGNLQWAAALVEWMRGDDRVKACTEARLDALFGLEPTFEPGAGRARKSSRVVKALEAGEDWWRSYPERELRKIVSWGIDLGVAPARHYWTERADHGGRVLPMPRLWHPQTLRWSWHERRWTLRDQNHVELVVTPGDGEWILHTPFGEDRPWADGLWRSIARWVLLKQYAQGDWGRHSEKNAKLVVTAPVGATRAQRQELAQDLASSGTDAVIALANGFAMELLELTANTRQIYQAQIEMADLAIAILYRGGNLSTNVEGGSRAAAESQAKTGDTAKLRFDAQSITTTIHEQSLRPWAEYNYGDPALAPWPAYPVEPEEDKAKRATMVKTLGEGLTVWDKLGFDVDPKAVQEEFGLTFLRGRSRERAPDPVPAPPAPKDGEPEPEPAPKDRGKARSGMERPRLASGAPLNANSGFVNGQLYSDDLVDSASEKGGKALASTLLDELREVIRNAKSYDEVRSAVLAKYREARSPTELRKLTQNALVLADMAGALAVRQDS